MIYYALFILIIGLIVNAFLEHFVYSSNNFQSFVLKYVIITMLLIPLPLYIISLIILCAVLYIGISFLFMTMAPIILIGSIIGEEENDKY